LQPAPERGSCERALSSLHPGRIYPRLHAQIQDTFNAAGVEIMASHSMNLRDGNAVTIPDEKKPAGYEAPRFRVEATKKV
jgi:hypothetical protein